MGSYYGEPTGVLGLRLFPNPDFDEAARARWDPERFYGDADYYNDKDLVRPYRVGMACAFCHVGPSPIHPPKDVENPAWSELASNPGAQYFWVDRIFFWNTRPREDPAIPAPNEANVLYQLFHTNPPGALDTSLVSTDYMNNPRTMNAVYETIARLGLAPKQGIETLKAGELDNEQFQNFTQTASLASFFDPATGRAASMRVLKDGSDSVGTLGALNRVYLNIGLFSEEWLLHFRAFAGGRKISAIPIETARRNSVYWQATEAQTPDMAIFFLVVARADRLADAPGGAAVLARDADAKVERGKVVFAETCAGCHSSKQPVPDPAFGVDGGACAGGGAGPGYRDCWDRYRAWTQSDAYKAAMREMVAEPDFLDGNFLSTDRRVPLDVIGTNACSAIATNALAGDIWADFSSSSYKSLPPSKPVTVHHPVSGGATEFAPLGNGRGYVRPASLVSLWSTAPYLQNNSVGYDPAYYSLRPSDRRLRGGAPLRKRRGDRLCRDGRCPAGRRLGAEILPVGGSRRSRPALRGEPAERVRPLDPPASRSRRAANRPADHRAGAGLHLPHLRAVLPDRAAEVRPRQHPAVHRAAAPGRALAGLGRRGDRGRALPEGLPDQCAGQHPAAAGQRPAGHARPPPEDG